IRPLPYPVFTKAQYCNATKHASWAGPAGWPGPLTISHREETMAPRAAGRDRIRRSDFLMTVRSRGTLAGLLVSALLAFGVRPADDPNRTAGPQSDGSIVASNNQALTPAGRIIELGSPVRAKAIALNPNKKTSSAAVLLMGAAQPVIVLNTATG